MTKSVKAAGYSVLLVMISVLYGCVTTEKTVSKDGDKSAIEKNTVKDDTASSPQSIPECVKYSAVKIEELLKTGNDPNMKVVRDNDNVSQLLHIAVSCNDENSVKLLLDKGASVSTVDKDGNTPLHIIRSVKVAKLLLAHGADVKAKNKGGVTPFELVINWLEGSEMLEALKLFFDNGADVNERRSDGRLTMGRIIISFGSYNFKKEFISLALRSGLDVNANNGELLGMAVDTKQWELAELLIDNGARVDMHGEISGGGYSSMPNFFERIIYGGELKLIEKSIEALKVYDKRNEILDRAMVEVVRRGNVDVLKLLIASGGNVNSTGYMGEPLVYVAILSLKLEALKLLVENGADLKNYDAPILDSAVVVGDKDILKYLVGKGLSVNRGGEMGGMHLNSALRLANFEMARLLVELGADVNGRVSGKPLMINMINEGNVKAVRFLLKHGADKNVPSRMFLGFAGASGMPVETSITAANSSGNKELISLLSGESDFEFILASMKGDVAKVNSLVEKGFNPNFVDDEGDTPLLIAVSSGNMALVDALLSGNANPNIIISSNGKMPLHVATEKGNQGIMSRLIDAEADINAQDNHGRTPLHYAIVINDDAKTKFLLEHGASSNAKDYEGISVLSLAASKGNKSIFMMLFKAGAAIDAVNNDGMTVLHEAIKRKDGDFVSLILESGANANVRDNSGKMALHVAVLNGAEAIVRKLLSISGIIVDIQDNDGKTPLHYAVAAKNLNMIFNLVKSGASPYIKDNAGLTPMDIALIDKSSEKIINTLKRGANVVTQ